MKRLFFLMILIPLITNAQKKKGFAVAGGEFLIIKGESRIGVNAGGGARTGENSTLGTSVDFFVFGWGDKYFIPRIDARLYFTSLDKPTNGFFAVQPGWIVYNKSVRVGNRTVRTSGDISVDAVLGGYFRKGASPGVHFAAGGTLMIFRSDGLPSQTWGGKVHVGIFF